MTDFIIRRGSANPKILHTVDMNAVWRLEASLSHSVQCPPPPFLPTPCCLCLSPAFSARSRGENLEPTLCADLLPHCRRRLSEVSRSVRCGAVLQEFYCDLAAGVLKKKTTARQRFSQSRVSQSKKIVSKQVKAILFRHARDCDQRHAHHGGREGMLPLRFGRCGALRRRLRRRHRCLLRQTYRGSPPDRPRPLPPIQVFATTK